MLTLLCILKPYSAKIYYIVYVLLRVCRYMHTCEQKAKVGAGCLPQSFSIIFPEPGGQGLSLSLKVLGLARLSGL